MSGGIGSWLRGLMARRAHTGAGSSGAQERWLSVDDPANGYYNFRLMRFAADGDLVRYPDHVWSTATRWGRPGGLRHHLQEVAHRLDGIVYPDILVLLSADDRQRELERGAASWEDQLQALVARQFERLCDEQGWRVAIPERPVSVKVIGDGEPAMGGQPLGLDPGEFATVLLPNLYHGPTPDSRPFADVYIRIPQEAGGTGGFRLAGVFHDDQLAFTIGSHWLDNGRDPALPGSALYTLHRPPGQREVLHRLNPDLADAFRLRQTRCRQGDTVTVDAVESGLAALEVMLIPAGDRRPPASVAGAGATLVPEGVVAGEGMTMIPEPEPDPQVVLSRRALLIQRVHFPRVMTGYHLDIAVDGSVGPQLAEPAARLCVDASGIGLMAIRDDIDLDGAHHPPGATTPLLGERHEIAVPGARVVFRQLGRGDDPRWPYLGEVSVPAEPYELALGSTYRVGRDRRKCEIGLPDRAVSENIRWLPVVDPQGAVQIRGGEVPVASFTTDSIMVAGRHAEVDLRVSEPKVRALSRACPVFVRRRSGAVLRLIAKEGATAQPLRQGDELLVGNTLFRVILPHSPAPGRPVDLSPGSAPSPATPVPDGGPAGAEGLDTAPAEALTPAGAAHEVPAPPRRPRTLPHLGPQTDLSLPPRARPLPPRAIPRTPTRPPLTADATLVETGEAEPDEDRYGDIPRSLRTPMPLPALAVPHVSLDEGMTLMETR